MNDPRVHLEKRLVGRTLVTSSELSDLELTTGQIMRFMVDMGWTRVYDKDRTGKVIRSSWTWVQRDDPRYSNRKTKREPVDVEWLRVELEDLTEIDAQWLLRVMRTDGRNPRLVDLTEGMKELGWFLHSNYENGISTDTFKRKRT